MHTDLQLAEEKAPTFSEIGDVAIFGGRGAGAIAAVTLSRLAITWSARCLGFLNDIEKPGTRIAGHVVLGPFASWHNLPSAARFVAPLHKAKDMVRRAQIIRDLRIPQERWACLIDPQAVLASDVVYGVDFFAAPGASIMCGSRVGDHVTIRGGSQISHDCVVEDFVMVGTNAILCGYTTVREGAHIAPGAVLREGLSIGRYSVVGLGAVVLHDVPDGAIVAGNPARIVGCVFDVQSGDLSRG